MFALASVHVPSHLLRTLCIGLRTLNGVKDTLTPPPQPTHFPGAATLGFARCALSLERLSGIGSVFPVVTECLDHGDGHTLADKVGMQPESFRAFDPTGRFTGAAAHLFRPKHAVVGASRLLFLAFL